MNLYEKRYREELRKALLDIQFDLLLDTFKVGFVDGNSSQPLAVRRQIFAWVANELTREGIDLDHERSGLTNSFL